MTVPGRKRGVLLVLMLLAYLVMYAFTGYATHADSEQYIAMHIRRDPVYPLWLAALRSLFGGNERYLWTAGFLQCILNAFCCTYFADRFTRLVRGKAWLMIATLLLTFLPQVVTYALSVTHVYLAGDIMSESFSYPLFLLIFVFLLAMLLSKDQHPLKEKDTWAAFIGIFLMSMLRGQMLALIIVWLLVLVLRTLRDGDKNENGRKALQIGIALLAVLLFFPVRTFLLKSYTYAVRGRFETHPNMDNLALSHVLFVADREDASAVSDERAFDVPPEYTLRDYFLMMYDKMESLEMNHIYAEGTLYDRVSFMEYCNDPLKFDVTEDVVFQTLSPLGYDYETMDFMENHVAGAIRRDLLPAVFPEWAAMYVCLVFRGFVRSVGFTNQPVLMWLFFALEVSALAAVLAVFLKKKKEACDAAYALALTLLIMTGMATSISLIHVCLERYMFYLFPVFYAAALQLLFTLLWKREKQT